ncbi:ribonuclease R [Betaproteobacteria bacterium GR16-43]|nr:ribonuclease R [Betaproteobacteria bacterium GR16-43]
MRFQQPAHFVDALKKLPAFAWVVLKAFRQNQGLLLAGAVAYYALLSLVPLLILTVMALSYVVDQAELLSTLARYLDWMVPGQSEVIVRELSNFLDHGYIVGWVLVVTMLFFSSLAFGVLENAMSVIFLHRLVARRRHILVSMTMPYLYILGIGIGLFAVTLVTGAIEHIQDNRVSRVLLYLVGIGTEVFLITLIYQVMPVGRFPFHHALLGGVTATALWEITRHILRWYFSTLSQVGEVYGSFTTAVIIMFSFEFAAILLLLGAQVISEYERIGRGEPEEPPQPVRIDHE